MIPYNLENPDDKHELDKLCEEWITQDEGTHNLFIAEWDEADARLNGTAVPNAWSTEYSKTLASRNLPENEEHKDDTREYVTVNRARPNHESVLGDFLIQRRKLIITGRTPKDRNRAKVFQQRFEYIEDANLVPDTVYFPCMDQCFSKGLSWSKLTYNTAMADRLRRFQPEYISTRDVLVDTNSNMPFFLNAERIIHRQRFKTKELKKRLKKYPFADVERLSADDYYSQGWGGSTSQDEKTSFTTVYWIEFRREERDYLKFNNQTKQLEEITEEEYDDLQDNPATAGTVFEGPEEERYYIVLYVRNAVGAFYIEENPLGMFTLQPWINMYTEKRTYPLGDVKIFANLLDLFDVLITVFFHNAKRMNWPIADVDPEQWEEFGTQIEKALEEGGAAPGIKNIHYPQSINAALVQLIPWVLGWIQDSASQHSASRGELPSKQIARETVQLLIAKDRKSHGRKDVTINFALTMFARCAIKTIAAYEQDKDFIPLTDARPGEPDYIPINQVWSKEEYEAALAEYAQLPEPQSQQEVLEYTSQLAAIRKKFERTNDVKPEPVQGGFKLQEKIFTRQELSDYIASLGITQEQFFEQYQPVEGDFVRYRINELTPDADLNVKYRVDTDYQNDSDYILNRATILRREGVYSRADYARALGEQNADELIENADSENRALMLAKQLAANEEAFGAAMQILQAMKNRNGQPAGAVA